MGCSAHSFLSLPRILRGELWSDWHCHRLAPLVFLVFDYPAALPAPDQVLSLSGLSCGCDATPVITGIKWVSQPKDDVWTGEYTYTCTSTDGSTSSGTGQFETAMMDCHLQTSVIAPTAQNSWGCKSIRSRVHLIHRHGGSCEALSRKVLLSIRAWKNLFILHMPWSSTGGYVSPGAATTPEIFMFRRREMYRYVAIWPPTFDLSEIVIYPGSRRTLDMIASQDYVSPDGGYFVICSGVTANCWANPGVTLLTPKLKNFLNFYQLIR